MFLTEVPEEKGNGEVWFDDVDDMLLGEKPEVDKESVTSKDNI